MVLHPSSLPTALHPFQASQKQTNKTSAGQVLALTYSAGTGQYILTGSSDRSIRLFNPATGNLIQTYSAHGYEVLDLAVAEGNDKFVSVGGDKSVFLWDVASAQTLRRWGGGAGHAGRVNACCWGGEGDSLVLTGSFDATVKIWDTKQRGDRPIMTLSEARDSISSVDVSGAEILTGSVDGRVRCYDLRMGCMDQDVIGRKCCAMIMLKGGEKEIADGMISDPVTSVMTTKTNDSYLASTLDSTVRLMDKRDGKLLQAFREDGFTNNTYRIRSTLAAADSVVISGSEDGQIYVWDLLEGRLLHKLKHFQQTLTDARGAAVGVQVKAKKDVVSAVAWNQMRKEWASAGSDGSVVVWGNERR